MNVIQPSDILELAQVRNKKEGENLIRVILNILVYLNKGDTVVSGDSAFSKIDDNLIYVDTHIDLEELTESLQEKNIIRIPV